MGSSMGIFENVYIVFSRFLSFVEKEEEVPKKCSIFDILGEDCLVKIFEFLDCICVGKIIFSNKLAIKYSEISSKNIFRMLDAHYYNNCAELYIKNRLCQTINNKLNKFYLDNPFLFLNEQGSIEFAQNEIKKIKCRFEKMTFYEKVWHLTKKCDIIFISGGNNGHIREKYCFMMLIEKNKIVFERCKDMIHERLLHGNILFNNKIFSIGSSTGILQNDTIEYFDKFTFNNSELSVRLPHFLRNIVSVNFQNKLLIIGGDSLIEGIMKTSNLIYELEENLSGTFELKMNFPPMITPRFRAAAIEFDNKLYVCGGGIMDGPKLNSVEFFDPKVGIWQFDNSMIYSRIEFSLGVFQNELYAFGGSNTKKFTIEKRDSKNGCWKLLSILDENRYGCSSILVDSKIYVIGGNNFRNFNIFDLLTLKWASLDKSSDLFDETSRILPINFINTRLILFESSTIEKTY